MQDEICTSLRELGRREEAFPLLERLTVVRKKVLGEDHPDSRTLDLANPGKDSFPEHDCRFLANDGLCSHEHRNQDADHHVCHLRPYVTLWQ